MNILTILTVLLLSSGPPVKETRKQFKKIDYIIYSHYAMKQQNILFFTVFQLQV